MKVTLLQSYEDSLKFNQKCLTIILDKKIIFSLITILTTLAVAFLVNVHAIDYFLFH